MRTRARAPLPFPTNNTCLAGTTSTGVIRGFNMAVSGAVVSDMGSQARAFVQKARGLGDARYHTSWKLVTVLIGGNVRPTVAHARPARPARRAPSGRSSARGPPRGWPGRRGTLCRNAARALYNAGACCRVGVVRRRRARPLAGSANAARACPCLAPRQNICRVCNSAAAHSDVLYEAYLREAFTALAAVPKLVVNVPLHADYTQLASVDWGFFGGESPSRVDRARGPRPAANEPPGRAVRSLRAADQCHCPWPTCRWRRQVGTRTRDRRNRLLRWPVCVP